jgi:hypothetical protein
MTGDRHAIERLRSFEAATLGDQGQGCKAEQIAPPQHWTADLAQGGRPAVAAGEARPGGEASCDRAQSSTPACGEAAIFRLTASPAAGL